MGNPLKGAVSFELDGEAMQLSYSSEALYRLEEELGLKVNALARQLEDREQISMKLLRTLFWAGLLDTHETLKPDQVSSYFRRIAPVDMIQLVTMAFTGAFVDHKATPATAEASGTTGP